MKVLRGGSGAHFYIPIECKIEPRQLKTLVPPNSKILIADSNNARDSDDSSKLDAYYQVDYTKFSHICIVMNSETEGISKGIHQLISEDSDISRIHIPLKCGIDSLNVANAFGIIAFEICRQFIMCSKV